MALTRVGTLAQHEFTLARLQALQARLTETNIQVSSGQKARRYSGIATEAKQLVTLEATLSQTRRFISNNNTVERRLATMENQVSTMFNIASNFRTTLIQGLSGENANELDLPGQAQFLMNQVAGLLNVSEDGRYLFSGSMTNTAPVDLNDPQFTAPPAVYPSSSFKQQDAGSGAQSLASQGMTISYDADVASPGHAYRLDYVRNSVTDEDLTLTDLTTGTSVSVDIAAMLNAQVSTNGDNLAAGTTVAVPFSGLGVTVTLDSNFDRATDIRTAGAMDATGIGSANFTNTVVANDANGGVDNDTLTALRALGSSVYDPTTGLLTLTVDNSVAGEVHLSAAGVDLGQGVGVATADLAPLAAPVLIDVVVGGDTIAQLDLGDVTTSGTTNGTVTIDVGNLMFGQSSPGYYQGNDQKLTARAEENLELTYGVTANDPAFEKLIRALHLVATNPSNDRARLEEAQRLLVAAIDELPNVVTEIGLVRSTLLSSNETHENSTVYVEEAIGNIKFVDTAETLLKLSADQAALEASYATIAGLRQVSLINFL